MEHLSDDDLQTFFSLRAKPALSRRVVRHFLSECESCRKRALTVMHELGLDTFLAEEVDEETLFFEALPEFLKLSDLIREEVKRAKASFARLSSLPEKEQLAAVRRNGRYKKYGLALYILEKADVCLAKSKSGQAKELVIFSISMQEHLRERVYGVRLLADLRLRQLSTLANIRRGEEDFTGALATLEQANDLRHASTDPVEEARFLRVQAALLYDLGEFEEAGKAARESGEVYQLMGDDHSQAKALLQEAMILAEYDPAEGFRRVEEGLSLLNPVDSYAYVCGVLNRARCLIELNRAEEAAEYLGHHEEIVRKVADRRHELLMIWLDGKIMRERGRFRDAEEILSYLALRFSEERMNQEMLLVHIDRIELRLEANHWKSALNLARHLTPTLAKLGLRNDLLSVWAMFQDALSSHQAVIADVRDFFRRHWKTPAGLRLRSATGRSVLGSESLL
jgi:tetratricopeptide (TPR) repeat protein